MSIEVSVSSSVTASVIFFILLVVVVAVPGLILSREGLYNPKGVIRKVYITVLSLVWIISALGWIWCAIGGNNFMDNSGAYWLVGGIFMVGGGFLTFMVIEDG